MLVCSTSTIFVNTAECIFPRMANNIASDRNITEQGPTQPLNPPFPTPLPLWLALLLKRQRRANIVPPPWLSVDALSSILETEIEHAGEAFSPPPSLPPASTTSPLNPSAADYLSSDNVEFSPPYVSNTTGAAAAEDALPYHWLELSHLLLTSCADDMPQASTLTRLLRDIREVRQSKLRKGITVLDSGAGVQMNGVGAMEVAESRGL
ncbi:DNA replication protein psf2 [Taxawa tesnikishii (nom. ined.)]|nr:DNA replication protein psf2 [Dothideales sp. JES 119]